MYLQYNGENFLFKVIILSYTCPLHHLLALTHLWLRQENVPGGHTNVPSIQRRKHFIPDHHGRYIACCHGDTCGNDTKTSLADIQMYLQYNGENILFRYIACCHGDTCGNDTKTSLADIQMYLQYNGENILFQVIISNTLLVYMDVVNTRKYHGLTMINREMLTSVCIHPYK